MALRDELKEISKRSVEQALTQITVPVTKRVLLWFRDVWTKKGRARIQARRDRDGM